MLKLKQAMKKLIIVLFASSLFASCSFLDTEMEQNYDREMFLKSGYSNILNYGLGVYGYLQGLNSVSGTLLAAACDEADYSQNAAVQNFNTGAWDSYSNPDDVWGHYYKGIRHATLFLQDTYEYPRMIAVDTLGSGRPLWLRNCDNVRRLRAEVRLLRAYFYTELIKRYGGVPVVENVLTMDDNLEIPRKSFDECVQYIVDEIDDVYEELATHYTNFGYDEGTNQGNGGLGTDMSQLGRVDKPVAKALKLRVLLYAASKLHNPSMSHDKWVAAAEAGNDFMTDPECAHVRKLFGDNYGFLFSTESNYQALQPRADLNTGLILTRPYAANTNAFEKANYPVGMTNATGQCVCPSYTLIRAMGAKNSAWNPAKPLDNLDARAGYMIVTPGSKMGKVNGIDRIVESYEGGVDGVGARTGATTTGFYLRKFLCTNLDIVKGDTRHKSWVLMRYQEVLLNLAEAMNEAFGPDEKGLIEGTDYAYSARELSQLVTNSYKYKPEGVPASIVSKDDFRQWLIEERRVELAFEGHRFFDVRRWMIAEQTENKPLLGLKVSVDSSSGETRYEEFVVEQRAFVAPKMYLYPIPVAEINKSNGSLQQNPGW